MQVKIYNNIWDHLPEDYTDKLPFVYLPGYIDFLEKKYSAHVQLAIVPDEQIFVLLSVIKTKVLINAQLLSVPFKKYEILKKQDIFFEELISVLKKGKIIDRIITPQNFVVFNNCPGEVPFCEFGSYVIDLIPDAEVLYSHVHPKHRNKISKAERAGVTIRSGASQLSVFYDLHKATLQRSSMFCEKKEYYHDLYASLGEENCYCAVVYHNDVPQGAMFAPFTKFCCYYLYGASAANISESGAINYLHWHTILEMKKRGVLRYDFVGARLSSVSNTKLGGIQDFKERFGGTLQKGYLWKADINALKCKLYDKTVILKNKISGKTIFRDIIDQEIEKADT